jgi:uncharacterized membrane protein
MARILVKKKPGNVLFRMMPIHRFIISIILAGVVYLSILSVDLQVMVKIMISWSVFSFCYIITSWIIFFGQPPEQIQALSKREDGSRLYVFSLIIVSSFASLLMVLLLMLSQNTKATPQSIFIPVAIGGIFFSLFLFRGRHDLPGLGCCRDVKVNKTARAFTWPAVFWTEYVCCCTHY